MEFLQIFSEILELGWEYSSAVCGGGVWKEGNTRRDEQIPRMLTSKTSTTEIHY